MSKKVTDTRHGDHSKYDVVKDEGVFSSKYYVRKDDKPHRGSFSSRRKAVEAAEDESGDKRD